MNAPLRRALIAATTSFLPLLANAHVGGDAGAHHPTSLLDGFVHPLTGLDHLAGFLALGLWSASKRWQQSLPMIVCALLGLLGGAILANQGLHLPFIEPLIACSVLVLGLCLHYGKYLPSWGFGALGAAFTLWHGMAHGQALNPSAFPGMLAASLLLMLTGACIGRQLPQRARQLLGVLFALLGGGLFIATVA